MGLRRLSLITLGFIASTALSGAALAADIVEPTSYDWTGFYVGGHVGYGWIDLEGKYTGDPGEDFIADGGGEFDLDDNGFLFGAQIGFNWQIDNIVLGIEGDISRVNWKDKLINDEDELVSFDTDYLASLRARAGYAFDNVLLYATAGAAWTNTDYTVNDHIDSESGSEKGSVKLTDVGLVVGGGGAYALDENWSIRAEALYYIFDDKEDANDLTHNNEVSDFVKLDDIFVVRVGIDFKL